MKERVLIAGFGGQGVLLAGMVLANAGMKSGREVTWLPSYGPEMRGGTANCQVIISDKQIVSPIIDEPDSLIVMNGPSLKKFIDRLKNDGILLINSSLAGNEASRKDIKTYLVPANEIAIGVGNNRTANIVMLGAYMYLSSGVVSDEAVEDTIAEVLGSKKAELIDINLTAFKRGMEYMGGTYGNKDNKDR